MFRPKRGCFLHGRNQVGRCQKTFLGQTSDLGRRLLEPTSDLEPLTNRSCHRCTPMTFITQHWRGRNEGRHSFLLGIHHGVYCVGCCWALMLLMFAVGTGSVGWMLALGAVMAVEKNMPWGQKMSLPLGVFLLAWSGSIVLSNT